MPPVRGTSESKSMLIAVVIFVVLFLAAAVAAVMLYLERTDLIGERDQAQSRLNEIASAAQLNQIKPLAARGQTAMAVVLDDMQFMAQAILGQEVAADQPAAIRDRVQSDLGPVSEALDQVAAVGLLPADQLQVERGLAPLTRLLVEVSMGLLDRAANAEMQSQQLYEQYQQRMAALEAEVNEITEELKTADSKAQQLEASYDQLRDQSIGQYEQVIQKMRSDIQEAQTQADTLAAENRTLQDNLSNCQTSVGQLNQRLQQFQPQPEMEQAALEPDGFIVSVDEADMVAYINLGSSDQMYRGLKFAVYDRFRTIPKTGQGKGAVEVIEIMDQISKCRITQHDATNPIMPDDIIANLVWSRDKQYSFAVSGEFDFNGDGEIDLDGR